MILKINNFVLQGALTILILFFQSEGLRKFFKMCLKIMSNLAYVEISTINQQAVEVEALFCHAKNEIRLIDEAN